MIQLVIADLMLTKFRTFSVPVAFPDTGHSFTLRSRQDDKVGESNL